MKQVYKVSGLDCANCALTLEKKIQKISGVNSCNINFLGEKMEIDFEGDAISNVKDVCSKFEDGVSLKRIK